MAGGQSINTLNVSFAQNAGATSAQGGQVTSNGSATANPQTNAGNTGTNTTDQHQTPSQTGGTGDLNQTQDAHSGTQTASPTNEATNRALGRIAETAGGHSDASSGTQTAP